MAINYELLKLFCDPDRVGSVCEKPFVYGNKTVATNGQILLLVDGKFGDDACDYDLDKHSLCRPQDFETVPLPNYIGVEIPCDNCNGEGFVLKTDCGCCNGTGEIHYTDTYNNDYEFDCKECNGSGNSGGSDEKTSCTSCFGLGITKSEFMKFGHSNNDLFTWGISLDNWQLLSKLENVRVEHIWRPNNTILFSCNGGIGIISAYRKAK